MAVEQCVRFFKAVLEHERFIGQDIECGAFADKPALVKHKHTRAQVNYKLKIVRCNEFRAGQRLQKLLELAPATRVKPASRFIQHKHGRFACQHTSQTDPTFLALTESVWLSLFEPAKPDQRKARRNKFFQLRPVNAQLTRAKGDIVKHGRCNQLVIRVLEQQTDLLSDAINCLACERFTGNPHMRLLGQVFGQQTVQMQQQRGFASTIRPEHTNAFIWRNCETDVVQRAAAARIRIRQVPDFDCRVHFHPRAHMAR